MARRLALALGLGACLSTTAGEQARPPKDHFFAKPGNMNPNVRYIVSNPLSGHEGQLQHFTGDFFEVYSPPIHSRYSEVVWHTLPPVPLPEDIRRRYQDSIMAVTGWEVDVVRRTATGDESVPCYESYNHHYTAELVGRKARLADKGHRGHGHGPLRYEADDGPAWIPQVQSFNEHNGNEARQSFHGLPRGYVQPIESPSQFVMTPMQINTRNPDGSGRRGGPLPRSSSAPPDAPYSGLLECPCTTRRRKVLGPPVARTAGACGAPPGAKGPGDVPLHSADECFAAAAALFGWKELRNVSLSSAAKPPGCSVTQTSRASTEAAFNSLAASTTKCGAAGLLEEGVATCICRQGGGTIDGVPYKPKCSPWPLSDLAETGNPTCDVSTYVGGMECCRDGNFLLDADQEIPGHVDEVFFKWRFYFEDWDQSRHTQVVHLEWALNGCDSGGGHMACPYIEYDIPQAAPSTPPEERVHTVTSHFKVSNMLTPCDARKEPYCADPRNVSSAGLLLVMAGGHCHAPACLSLELWNEDTGELLCYITPVRGSGDAAQDEAGYLWLPHCAWGQARDGLRPPPVLHLDTNLLGVKRGNSTHYHYGVMAIWQMRAAYNTAAVPDFLV